MSRLAVAMESVADLVAAALPSWTAYVGYRITAVPPAFIVGLPVSVDFRSGPAGRALVTLPVTGVVASGDGARLVDFLTPDGIAERLHGAKVDGAWLGGLMVDRADSIRVAPNGADAAELLAADITIELLV